MPQIPNFTRIARNRNRGRTASTVSSSPCTTMLVLTSSCLSSRPENPQLDSLLDDCKSMREFKQIHSLMIRTGLARSPAHRRRLLASCCDAQPGDMAYARHLFDEIPQRDAFVWNSMIRAHSRRNSPGEAVFVYVEMLADGVRPNCYTFPFLLKCFTRDAAVAFGDELHAHVVKLGFGENAYVRNALLRVYALTGEVGATRVLFEGSPRRDAVMWNAVISGYNRSGLYGESCRVFGSMVDEGVVPNSVTYVAVLSACAKLKDLELGRRIHSHIRDSSMVAEIKLENALIGMYAECGDTDTMWRLFEGMGVRDKISWTSVVSGFAKAGQVERARDLFDRMPERDIVSWTAMIDAYVAANGFKEALVMFRKMQASKVRPDEFTMVSLLTACAQLGALEVGEWIKVFIERNNIKVDVVVGNALIDMYAKCGRADAAVKVFQKMQKRDRFTWTALIAGLAINGRGKDGVDAFHQMLRASVRPDGVTYVAVLQACAHAGLVDEGRDFFTSMIRSFGIMPNVMHYGCLVDLLCRAGQLTEALETIRNMPMRANSTIWGSLLAACRVHRNVKMAELAARQILELEPENNAVHVLLSNVYAKCSKWEDLRKVRELIRTKGVQKEPGCSLIEVNGEVHEFVAGDISHPRCDEIYAKLAEMSRELRLTGLSPDVSEVLRVEEGDKKNAVNQHSEKLAVAFGLIGLRPGATIRVVKNLKICLDCHAAIRVVSRIYGREIVVRDGTRFHHFRLGLCSCNEYW